jgi:hypothetical protein
VFSKAARLCHAHSLLLKRFSSADSLTVPFKFCAGMQWSKSGWALTIWNLGTRTKWQRQGLTPELLLDQLQALNVTPPVYLLDVSDHGQVQRDVQRLSHTLRKLFFDEHTDKKIAVRQVRSLHASHTCVLT